MFEPHADAAVSESTVTGSRPIVFLALAWRLSAGVATVLRGIPCPRRAMRLTLAKVALSDPVGLAKKHSNSDKEGADQSERGTESTRRDNKMQFNNSMLPNAMVAK